MAKQQPKKTVIPINFKDRFTGFDQRSSYSKEILYKTTGFPKTIVYEDIDQELKKFVENKLSLTDENGNDMPTFTLYSSQRFSEYSQTWEHTDENGNLLMNFKTINRDNNPKEGTNQAHYWNIPGERYYTLFQKDVLEDNGQESVEIYSMKQPLTVDLYYHISMITNVFENVNKFNIKVNDLFKARQCYIRVNGHYLPMLLEEINDESEYSIEDRKFYSQSIGVKVLAYIIKEEDLKVSKFPKYPKLYEQFDKTIKKPTVEIEEYENSEGNGVRLIITFKPFNNKVEFTMDENVEVNEIVTENIRSYRIFVNDIPYFGDKIFKIRDLNEVKIKVKPIDLDLPSKLWLNCESLDNSHVNNGISENVKEEFEKNEEINVNNS